MKALLTALDRLIAAGGPESAPADVISEVLIEARRVVHEAREQGEQPHVGVDPTNEVAERLVRHGNEALGDLDSAPDPLAVVLAVKRSVRLAIAALDAHVREVYRRRVAERGRMLGEFGRTLTHEIKNRLGAAETALLMLEQMPDADDALRERIFTLVERSLDDALRSVQDVRGMSSFRTASGFPATRPAPVDEVVRRAVTGLRLEAERRGVDIRVDALPTALVDGGPARLILTNLIENSIKYSDPNRSDARVHLSAEVVGDAVVVVVDDNGVGISSEFHEAVFHRSVQVDDERPGSGLGLAIVREAARELGGEVDLESAIGVGTRITVRLPTRARPD